MRSTKAFLIGVGTAYLFDPEQGSRRRSVARDRIARLIRRAARLGRNKARFTAGRLQGLRARALRLVSHARVAVDDRTVEQRIRSDAFRDVGVSTKEVDVEVRSGIATLRGSVGSRSLADDLVARVAKVPGVEDVAAMIRVDTPAAGNDT